MIPLDRLELTDRVAARLMTLVMLASVGIPVGRTFLQRFSMVPIACGIWDLCYYLPEGPYRMVWTSDILFLIPVPWVALILAPTVNGPGRVCLDRP